MDLVSSLKDDHEIIRKLIQELESAENLAIKNKIFTEMLVFVKAHFRAEEMALYSRSLRSPILELNEIALDGYEEHHLLEDLVYDIKIAQQNNSLWLAGVKEFCQILDLHLASEEADYFPELENYFTKVELDRATVVYMKSKKSEIVFKKQEQIPNPDVNRLNH